jgi:hypothetical protein
MSCDLPDVRSALKLRTPTDSQDGMNRIGLFLKSSAGSAREKIFLADESESSAEDVEGFYGFNRRFGGVAGRNRIKRSQRSHPHEHKDLSQRDMKCLVCLGPHRAREKHIKQEIFEPLRKKRAEGSITVANVAFEDILEIYDKDVGDDEYDVNETSENDPRYNLATKNEESTVWIAISNSNLIEKMSNCAFLAGIGFKVRKETETRGLIMSADEQRKFESVIIDTGANRRSMMSKSQFRA